MKSIFMKENKLLLFCLLTSVASTTIISCKKDSANHTPSVSISDTAKTVNENVGTVSVTINLSQTSTETVKLDYELTGTAVLNGDFEVDSASHITVAPGKQTATLKFTIYDDPVVESDKTIQLKFSSTANVSFKNTEVTITIKDNDVSQAANGLQTDLTWNAGSLVNLNLYVANNVVIDSNNTVTHFDIVTSSEHQKGFESVLINNNDADGKYYLVASYQDGSRQVNYTVTFSGPGISNQHRDDSFAASDSGYAVFYGPITKNGSSYARQRGSNFVLNQMKPHLYHGLIRKQE
jgi:Calx-beta domain